MCVWINRAGQGGILEFKDLFLKEKIIAIDWMEIKEDLTNINDKEELREIYIKTYPEDIYKQNFMKSHPKKIYEQRRYNCHVGNSVGQIWRFLKEMKKGDIVLIPIENDKLIVVAEIVGNCEWIDEIPRHRRKIKIIGDIPGGYYLECTGSKGLCRSTVARLKDKDGKYLSKERIFDIMEKAKNSYSSRHNKFN